MMLSTDSKTVRCETLRHALRSSCLASAILWNGGKGKRRAIVRHLLRVHTPPLLVYIHIANTAAAANNMVAPTLDAELVGSGTVPGWAVVGLEVAGDWVAVTTTPVQVRTPPGPLVV